MGEFVNMLYSHANLLVPQTGGTIRVDNLAGSLRMSTHLSLKLRESLYRWGTTLDFEQQNPAIWVSMSGKLLQQIVSIS